jgi:phenylalanyl-tRNA synthetase alpha subunit
MSLLQEIEPLKNAALAELAQAADLASLDQARVKYLGANGSFTGLLKQLGTLPKEPKPPSKRCSANAAANSNSKQPCRRNPSISACLAAVRSSASYIRSPKSPTTSSAASAKSVSSSLTARKSRTNTIASTP